ncbi:molybdopterin converting factor subunit 1 [Virgibacillus sp. W0430]|uniref:molybdopterin converting factor subunit 1 n=1 Tax=Virgibacillus sp. W0430 TaxID=3391580 RepID=UPI003F45D9C3
MVDVLFFAELQEEAGSEKITVDAVGLTVKELIATHLAVYNFKNIQQAMIAINEEYSNEQAVLSDGDVVAFIPPVSGG